MTHPGEELIDAGTRARVGGGRHDSTGAPVSNPSDHEPPVDIVYELEEALDLLAAMEDARDALSDSDHLAVLIQVEHQVELLSRRLGFNGGDADVN